MLMRTRPGVPQPMVKMKPDLSRLPEESHDSSAKAPLRPTKSHPSFVTNPYAADVSIHWNASIGRYVIGPNPSEDPESDARRHWVAFRDRVTVAEEPLEDPYSLPSSTDSHFAVPIIRRRDSGSAISPEQPRHDATNVVAPPAPEAERGDL